MRAVVAILVGSITLSAFAQSPAITVYVGAPLRGGFVDTDKAIQDSIADIKTRVAKLKGVKIVPARDGADLLLTVNARGVGSRAFGQRINIGELYGQVELTNQPMVANTYWTSAVLQVGDYRKEIIGHYTHEYSSSLGAWGDNASQITRTLSAWIDANREQIIAKRQ